MKQLSIELKPAGRPSPWAWRALLLIGLLAVTLVVATVYRQRELRQLREHLHETMQGQKTPPVAPPALPPRRAPYDASAREMLAEATSEWPAMLTALETTAVLGVTPISVEIVSAERQARVEVEFSDYAALLKYLDDLNAGEQAPRWVLIQAQGSRRPQDPQPAARPATALIGGEWKR